MKKKARRPKQESAIKKPPAARGGTKTRAHRATSKPRRGMTTTTKPPENMVHHLCQVGKPFLISTFQSMVGARDREEDVLALCHATTRNRTDALWDSLAGTPWQDDHDVALAALAASLSPIKLVDLAENDEPEEDDDAGTSFSSKALETIVDMFQRLWRLNVLRVKRVTIESCCMFFWAALAGTPWCGRNCVEVAGAALRAYLDPALLADANVLATPDSAAKLLLLCVTKQAAKALYRLIPKTVQRVTQVSFIALKLGITTFRQLHPSVKTEKVLLAGLRENQFSWESLPPEMKQNIQYALAIPPDPPQSPTFAEVWAAVVSDEKDRLWTEAHGDTVCRNCGVVAQESILDDGPEWNTYGGDNADATAALAKQRTAGPVRPDGTLEPTSLSISCYGGGRASGGGESNNNTALRRRLARIQHVRDYQLEQQRDQLYKDVAIDLAVRRRNKKKQKLSSLAEWMVDENSSGGSSSNGSSGGGDDQDDDIDDSDEDDATSYDADETAPPRNMILIEEHLEAQIEREQFQLDETRRRANLRKWTLPTRDGAEADNDGDDGQSDDDHDDPLTSKKHKKKQKRRRPTKRERADFDKARQTLTHAVTILRNLAQRHGLSQLIIDDAVQKFQYYGATHDTLPNAACAAILYLSSNGRYFLEPYETNRPAVRKMIRRIAKQFPQWNKNFAATATVGAVPAATGSTKAPAATAAGASTMTTANAEAAIHAMLDRLKLPSSGATTSKTPSTLWRDATLAALREDGTVPPPPATILAAAYFCATVSQKLAQLGLTTTNTIAPQSVAQLAKQAAVPASRIRAAYQTAPRDIWLDRVAQSVLPQALLVRQLLPGKAV